MWMKDVARIELANLGGFLAALDLGYDFRGQQHLGDEVLEFLGLFELLDVGLHLVLLAGEGVEREPLGAAVEVVWVDMARRS
jgi:hypothetical protein